MLLAELLSRVPTVLQSLTSLSRISWKRTDKISALGRAAWRDGGRNTKSGWFGRSSAKSAEYKAQSAARPPRSSAKRRKGLAAPAGTAGLAPPRAAAPRSRSPAVIFGAAPPPPPLLLPSRSASGPGRADGARLRRRRCGSRGEVRRGRAVGGRQGGAERRALTPGPRSP